MVKRTQVPELKVLFDTNALYTEAANELVRLEVEQLIQTNSNHHDLIIKWYLPDIVRHERQYQMLGFAKALLTPIKKVERLLGVNLNITEANLGSRVNELVQAQIARLNFTIVMIDKTEVDWQKIMHNSVYRLPPFDPGEKEKGFRDALVLESLLQIVKSSPVTESICRIVLVARDEMLAKAATTATSASNNVRILRTIEELKGLISTLVSEVGEQFVAELLGKATSYFFEKGKQSGFLYRGKILERIKTDYSTQLNTKPIGVDHWELDEWLIGDPRFVKKEQQRIFWTSRVEAIYKCYKRVYRGPQTLTSSSAISTAPVFLQGSPNFVTNITPNIAYRGLAGHGGGFPMVTGTDDSTYTVYFNPNQLSTGTELVQDGLYTIVFEVDWSVILGQNKKFTTPKVVAIKYIEITPRH